MKPSYSIFVLLCTVAIVLVRCENGTGIKSNDGTVSNKDSSIQGSPIEENGKGSNQTNTTTAVPTSTNPTEKPASQSTEHSSTPATPSSTTVTEPTTKPTTPTKPTTTTTTVTPTTTTTSKPTTTTAPNTTTPIPPTTTVTPTTVKPTTPNPNNTTTASPNVTTTAVPPTPSGRHFDGLSFLGGIILAVCLMAIGVFLWKFSRKCNEGNYRTL